MILVTGGTGFLGAHLLDELVQSGEKVRAIYRSKPFKYLPKEIVEQIDWKKADVLDELSLDEAMDGISQVFHCAGKVSFLPNDKEELFETNVKGTANVVNSCLTHQVERLIYVSSVAALGRTKDDKPITETTAWEDQPNTSVYGKSKYLAELEIWRGIAEGLSALIVNPSTLIGPSLFWEEGTPKLFKKIANGFSYYPIGTNGFADVRDSARLIRHLMRTNLSEERFIINNDNWSFKRLFFTIKKHFNLDSDSLAINPAVIRFFLPAAQLKAFFLGKNVDISKEMIEATAKKVHYNNRKIAGLFPSFEWTDLEETIADTCQVFLEQKPDVSSQ